MAAFYTGFAWWWMAGGWLPFFLFFSLFLTPKTFNPLRNHQKKVDLPSV